MRYAAAISAAQRQSADATLDGRGVYAYADAPMRDYFRHFRVMLSIRHAIIYLRHEAQLPLMLLMRCR